MLFFCIVKKTRKKRRFRFTNFEILRENESLVHFLREINEPRLKNTMASQDVKHQIKRSITSEHQLNDMDGHIFIEKRTSKEFHDVVYTIHSRQIDGVFFKVRQTKTKDGELIDESIETNIDTRNWSGGKFGTQSHLNINTVYKFNFEWESGWNPTIPKGFFSRLKKSLKSW